MRSMVEREALLLRSPALDSSASGFSLSDPALPGHLSLRERKEERAAAFRRPPFRMFRGFGDTH